jgi:hypothetical protein
MNRGFVARGRAAAGAAAVRLLVVGMPAGRVHAAR